MSVKGLERVQGRLKTTIEEIRGKKSIEAVYVILSQGAAISATMIPIDEGNLINSQTEPNIVHQVSGNVSGSVGYTAAYAGAVHDASGTLEGQPRANGNGQYWDPAGEPGFMEKGFEEVKASVPAILRRVYDV